MCTARADKPNSVWGCHLSCRIVADTIVAALLTGGEARPCTREGLPPKYVTAPRCELLPHSFHLFLLRLLFRTKPGEGSLVSVALSLSRRTETAAVNGSLVMIRQLAESWCSDFPDSPKLGAPGSLARAEIIP